MKRDDELGRVRIAEQPTQKRRFLLLVHEVKSLGRISTDFVEDFTPRGYPCSERAQRVRRRPFTGDASQLRARDDVA